MARELAGLVNKTNDERRNFDAIITREALEMIQNNESIQHSKTTVLFKNDWHKGVIGIVASRCIEKYYRPTVILTESNQKATGSVRSVPGFDVYEAIEECADLLEQFGGHQYAAGLTLSLDKVEAFREKFEMVVARKITAEILTPLVNIDLEIPLWRINTNYHGIIKQMAPFGPGNMQPVFATHQVKAMGQVRILKEEHLKFSVTDPQTGREITCIGFGMAEYAGLVESGMEFSIAYTIEENEFRGVKTLQAQLKDLKFD
jgi:single-stranded-DNA-specific exonuclease